MEQNGNERLVVLGDLPANWRASRSLALLPILTIAFYSGFLSVRAQTVEPPQVSAAYNPADIQSYRIESLSLDEPDRTRFGSLDFKGGLALTSRNTDFGALSGLRMPDGRSLTAVADTGFWIAAELDRDDQSAPSRFANGRITPLQDGVGGAVLQKWAADIEGITFSGDRAFISTEQDARVLVFPFKDGLPSGSGALFGPPIPAPRLSYSFGLEAVATLPVDQRARLGGATLVAISEGQPTSSQPLRAFLIGEGQIAEFQIERSGSYLTTDADFLPSGDLVLLERHFSPVEGPHMRIRRIAVADIVPGATVDGTTLMELGPRHQIDNMEGISVFTMPNGEVRVALVSDNNQWLLQRTLYLEFAFPAAGLRVD
ncbi:MAG: esterase-like activity of phytase family protein [Pseudomonadota bacterium]